MKHEDDLLTLAPMKDYQMPDLPTLGECRPEVLKKVPSRWKNKIMATTVAGLFGVTMLTGCSTYHALTPTDSDPWTDDWMHHGGSGGAPLYVAYLTEQEALGIIRTQLEAAGLNFDKPSQPYNVQVDNWSMAELVLVHEEKDLNIVLIDSWWRWNSETLRLEFNERAVEQFEAEFGIEVDGVIFNPQDEVWNERDEPEMRMELEEDIIGQVQDFIDQLRVDGVIE